MDRTSRWTVRRWDWSAKTKTSWSFVEGVINGSFLVFFSTTMIRALWTAGLPISGCLKKCSRLQLRPLKLPLRSVLTLFTLFHSSISTLFHAGSVSISECSTVLLATPRPCKTHSCSWVGLRHVPPLTFRECHLNPPSPGSWVTVVLLHFLQSEVKIYLLWQIGEQSECNYNSEYNLVKGKTKCAPEPVFADWTVSLWVLARGTAGLLAGWNHTLAHFPSHLSVPDEWKPQPVL